jgi:hypothetical protein
MLAQRAGSAVTQNPTVVQPQKGEEQLDKARRALPLRLRQSLVATRMLI